MSKDFESIWNKVLLALQFCLGVWQFTKLTPVGALIKGVVSWLLRPFRLSETYSRLQIFDGRVFKKMDCFVLQPEIPSARRGGVELGKQNRLQLHVTYLGKEFVLEKRGNMLFVDGKMCYYIIPTVWAELQFLESVIESDSVVQRAIRTGALTTAAAHAPDADALARFVVNDAVAAGVAALAAAASYARTAAASATDLSAAAAGAAALTLARRRRSVVLKGHREFWEDVSTGGIMSLDDVLDRLILHNQHLSLPLADNRLLPVNLSVSEEKLLKILNLFAVFLQTKKEKVHWLIPTSLSFISALLEFSTPLRVWLYTNINVLFCSIMHSMCDLLPRPWRRQVYSLGKWVENLKPTNDIQLKIQRGNIRAIIAGCAKIDRQGASLVRWLKVTEEEEEHSGLVAEEEEYSELVTEEQEEDKEHSGHISKQFHCNSIGIDMTCTYFVALNRCHIDAPTVVSKFTVECGSMEEYRRIITLVSCMANNGCGSLKSCGPHNKVSVRGFRESVLCYVKSGFPPVYELQLENVVLT